MANFFVRKLYNGLVPVDQTSADIMAKLKPNGEYQVKITQPRNIAFHRKAWALLQVIYDAWEPSELTHKGVKVQKNLESLRNDLTILAGYYTSEFKYDGTLRLRAKSWSFASMSQEDFEEMYSKIIDVALAKILINYSRDDIDYHVEQILRFS